MSRSDVPENWPELPDEELLNLRLSDLPLKIESTVIEGRIAQLRAELEARELRFPIHFYISDEWFTPDGTATMAVPFYLAHPRLERLEKAQMLEVEGGEHEWCMRILRHEAGHVIDNVYKLRLRRQRRDLFGSSGVPYPEFYDPKPYSKLFVQHIDPWYAQSHPDEDFAETFAVWLTPESNWQRRFAGWPALGKLEYVDTLMRSLRNRKPLVENFDEIDPIRRLRHTLRRHYRRKRRHHGVEHPKFYDRDLRRLFSDAPECAHNMTAAQFLGKIRQPVRRVVASWTGIYQYTIDKVLEDMITRCRELKLRLAVPEEQARYEFTVLLTVQTVNYLHSGRHRVAL
ncbi:MAG TPA: putative zinc-binding metallopeptidase [Vicinamibacterales bacterium]|nr:putative zinc-binding metallopeptidase [Vicinamibacterales bacterium]